MSRSSGESGRFLYFFVECIYNLSGNHCLVGLLFNYYVASSGVKLILGL